VKAEVRKAEHSDRELIRRMMELYLHDFSEYENTDLDAHGLYGYDDLDYFWFEPTHAVFVIRVEGKLAGFVLVDNDVKLEGSEREICEFFVLRKYRRQGVGRQAALVVFDQIRTKWEVDVMAPNVPAIDFWRKVIAEYTGGKYEETLLDNEDWKGPVFTFDNRLPSR
jgi:predicted acetyltransferase